MDVFNRARDIELDEIKKSLEFAHETIREQKSCIDNLKMQYKNVNFKFNTLSQQFDEFLAAAAEDHDRLIYLDDYGRRSSLRIRGIPEEPRETWEQCQAKVARLLREKLGMTPEIERAHRLGPKDPDRGPREVIVKFLRFPDKEEILQNKGRLDNSGVTIREDFCGETLVHRASYSDTIRDARANGLIAYMKYRTYVEHPPRGPAGRRGGANGNRGGANAGRGGANGSRGDASGGRGGASGSRGGANGGRGGANSSRGGANGGRGGANGASGGGTSGGRGGANGGSGGAIGSRGGANGFQGGTNSGRGGANGTRGGANGTRGGANGSRGGANGARGGANRGRGGAGAFWASIKQRTGLPAWGNAVSASGSSATVSGQDEAAMNPNIIHDNLIVLTEAHEPVDATAAAAPTMTSAPTASPAPEAAAPTPTSAAAHAHAATVGESADIPPTEMSPVNVNTTSSAVAQPDAPPAAAAAATVAAPSDAPPADAAQTEQGDTTQGARGAEGESDCASVSDSDEVTNLAVNAALRRSKRFAPESSSSSPSPNKQWQNRKDKKKSKKKSRR